jgi:hypothetical protein
MDRLEKLKVRCIEKPFDIHHLAGVVNEVADMEGPPKAGATSSSESPAPPAA